MEVTVVRGSSYISDTNKIDPHKLSREQEQEYIGLVIKTKLIEAFNGSVPRVILDEALSLIDYSKFSDINNLNQDSKLLLENLIKYQLFIRNINFEDIDIGTIINRL